MAYCIQDCFAHDTFIEGKNVKYKETFLIMLFIIPQVDKFPNAVITGKESDTKLFSLVCGAGRFG